MRAKAIHGTYSKYKGGCKCSLCRAANVTYMKGFKIKAGKAMAVNPNDSRHGTATGYRRGCKCLDCKMAGGAYQKEWDIKHPERAKVRDRKSSVKFRKKNPEKVRASRAKWVAKNVISCRLRSRLAIAVRRQLNALKPDASAIKDLGMPIDKFLDYLSTLFTEDMSWENYGEWHIDHHIPLCSFDLSDAEQVKKACHYTNLRPLWGRDNLSKGGKIPDE